MEAWFKLDALPSNVAVIVQNGHDETDGYGLAVKSDGKLYGRYGGGVYFGSTTTVGLGTWHHAVLDRAAGVSKLYLDGAQVASSSTAPTTAPSGVSIGSVGAGTYFNGAIAEVAIYNASIGAQIGNHWAAAKYTASTSQNLTTAYEYDALGRQTDTVSAGGVFTHATFDNLGRQTSGIANWWPGHATTAVLNVTGIASYGTLGELVATCSPNAVAGGCTPDRLATSSDAWHYDYDAMGRATTVKPPVDSRPSAPQLAITTTTYDTAYGSGRVARICEATSGDCTTGSNYRATSPTYDRLDRTVSSISRDTTNGTSSVTTNTTYDLIGRQLTVSANGGTLTAAYDDATATTTVTSAPATGPTGTTVTSLNADGTVKTRRDNGGTTTTFQYDPLGRLTRAPMPNLGGSQPAFYWRLDGLLDSRTLGGATLSYAYDPAKRPTAVSVTGSPTGTLSRTLDRVANVTSEAQTLSGVATVAGNGSIQYFGYDALSRVTAATWSQTPAGASNESFTYDADSNRLTATTGGTTTTTVYTVFDAPLTVQTGSGAIQTTTYDVLGRMRRSYTGSTVYTNYTYDAAGKLVSITPSSGAANTVTFSLDALGRHSQRVVGNPATATEQYTYLGVTDTATRVATVGGSTTDGPIDALGDRLAATVGGTTVNWLLPDLHGNTAASFAGAAYSAAYRYDPYGDNVAASTGAAAIPWRFQGRLLESAAGGDELYDFDARSYDPALGAFTSLDSVAGSIQNPLTLNRYLYANANPTTLIDPDGHRPCMWGDTCGDTRYSNSDDKPANRTLPKPDPADSSSAADASPLVEVIPRILDSLIPDWRDDLAEYLYLKSLQAAFPTLDEWDAWPNEKKLEWSSDHWGDALLLLEEDPYGSAYKYSIFLTYDFYLASFGTTPSTSAMMFFDPETLMEQWDRDRSKGDFWTLLPIVALAVGMDSEAKAPGRDKPGGSTCSFSANTSVAMGDGTMLEISQVKPGDSVLAYNPDTHEIGSYRVSSAESKIDPIVEHLVLTTGTIESTPDHLFFTSDRGFVRAGELHAGEGVVTAEGEAATVVAYSFEALPTRMWDLTVEEAHTFFVSDAAVLVHNHCGGKWKSAAEEIARATGGTLTEAKSGHGWTIKIPGKRTITVRVMAKGGTRTDYFRVAVEEKGQTGAVDKAGKINSDPGLTHHDIGSSSSAVQKILDAIRKAGNEK